MSNKKAPEPVTRRQFGRPRLLIVGCGDVGMRLVPLLRDRYRVFALTSQPDRCTALRAAGATPLVADLDHAATLGRLAGLAHIVIHLAPPQMDGLLDRRTRRLIAILPEHAQLVYISTSGVYGDCDGKWIDETHAVAPQTGRASRRVDAERALRAWGRRRGGRISILRVPGIYAAGRLPIARLQNGLPALLAAEDVYTNHVHADDLARIIVATLRRALPGRVYHAVDDSNMKMAEFFDAVAEAHAIPRPPRLSRSALSQTVSPMLLSFMSESRRLRNDRLKNELGVRLQYPRVADMLAEVSRRVSASPAIRSENPASVAGRP